MLTVKTSSSIKQMLHQMSRLNPQDLTSLYEDTGTGTRTASKSGNFRDTKLFMKKRLPDAGLDG
jgi:hypothetical protein